MTVSSAIRLLDLKLLPHTLAACLYLESHGFRFCVDFGYQNATEKARAHWTGRKKKRLRYPL